MATKRYTPLDDPPSASSDDDETEDEQEILTQKTIDESTSEEEEEDDDDDEEEEEEEEESGEETPEPIKYSLEKPQIQNPNSKSAKLLSQEPITVTPNSSSIYEFDCDVRSPTASDFAIKPSKKIKAFESPGKTPTSKRGFVGSEIKEKKKVKVLNGDVDDEKKSVIKRVWSVDDELMLLQGFIDYQGEKGCSPLSDMDGFYQFTMNILPGSATKSQLYEKIRRLKKKFRVTSEKLSVNGEEPVFAKAHERNLFELSNKIWGVDGCESVNAGGGSNAKGKVRVPKVKPKVEAKEKVEDYEKKVEEVVKKAKVEDFETLYPYWNAGLISEVSSALRFPADVVNLVKENLSLIGEAKAKEMNEKWEVLFENESVLRKRRIALLNTIGNVETA
ncbi:hypothetical protein QVD17_03703 [Tagetes erecta]|uniref:Glabrous enhancer-binding protein-like DBD domain-containing protein n=1 Tax=Tagetes erecta TaxID=13708 RepID=A0AAD8LE21_TARER|nr:hypothetical protein QVD17_03703 [Tagetes erecta]